MKTKNVEHVDIWMDPARYTPQAGVTELSNGEIIVVFNEARGREHLDFDSVCMIRSKDGGSTWDPSSKSYVWKCTHHFGADIPSVAEISNGDILVDYKTTKFIGRAGILEDSGVQSDWNGLREMEGVTFLRSTDGGDTWSEPWLANIAPMRSGSAQDAILELSGGTLVLPVQGTITAVSFINDIRDTKRSYLIRSDNYGLDWEYFSTIAYDPAGIIAFAEPAIGRTGAGRLVCVMRTMHQPRKRHGNQWTCYSDNDGESWSTPVPMPLWGYPADLTTLTDGRLLCTYSHRRNPYGVRGCVSEDGINWEKEDEFTIEEIAQGEPPIRPPFHHIGYPTTIVLRDGRYFSVYHKWSKSNPMVQYVCGTFFELED